MTDVSFATTWLHEQIERLRSGDLAAQEALVQAVGARLRRIAHRMLQGYPSVRRQTYLAHADIEFRGATQYGCVHLTGDSFRASWIGCATPCLAHESGHLLVFQRA